VTFVVKKKEDGEWRMEDGEWRMEDGEWRMENGGWRVEDGEWRMESGGWKKDFSVNLCVIIKCKQFPVLVLHGEPQRLFTNSSTH
jgi:hypothetical protein